MNCDRCNNSGEENFKRRKKNGGFYSVCDNCRDYLDNTINKKHNYKIVDSEGKTNQYGKTYPAPGKSIYGLFNSEDILSYVGESKCTPYRLYCHLGANNGALKDLDSIEGYHYKILWDGTDKTRQDRLMAESVLIHTLRPVLNKQWQKDDD